MNFCCGPTTITAPAPSGTLDAKPSELAGLDIEALPHLFHDARAVTRFRLIALAVVLRMTHRERHRTFGTGQLGKRLLKKPVELAQL
jgi:hypothetical protein